MAVQQHSPLELEPWNDLNGKVVMVTGASAGLGREFCLDLARAGCKIIAAARRVDRLQSLCDELNQLNYSVMSSTFASPISPMAAIQSHRAVAVELDVSANEKSIEEKVRKAWDSFGFIDTLVNNAGLRGKSIMILSCWI